MGKRAVSKLPATLRHDGRLALHLAVAAHVGVGRVDDVTTANRRARVVSCPATRGARGSAPLRTNRRARVVSCPATRGARGSAPLRHDRISTAVINLQTHNSHTYMYSCTTIICKSKNVDYSTKYMIQKKIYTVTFAHMLKHSHARTYIMP